jgi:hypothetical protein
LQKFVIIVLNSVGTSCCKKLFNRCCVCYFQTSVCSIFGTCLESCKAMYFIR